MDRRYFESYCGRAPYAEIYLEHSGIENCLATLKRSRIRVRSVLVLGAATGEVLQDFFRARRVRPFGCEVSRWAHARIPGDFRRRVRRADLRRYVPDLARAGRHFDLCFANSLVYLRVPEVVPVLRDCAQISRWFHFWSSTSESFEPGDRHRTLLRPRAWWRARFVEAGFAPTRSPYLWRSEL
jgi:hypothetical protein